ncbi:hypothetical protein E2I00_018752 [Balaenoptera physalus]|uniref:Uncharacterized protein n=1 Tax=Balaenoptera physalus TaxID=9770 RepID=A0A643CHD6_BALPH|nr:hypothetical protein E2I00_018752 [Balaenoptera physalus]
MLQENVECVHVKMKKSPTKDFKGCYRDPGPGRDQDPGLFHDQEAADRSPDLHLQKEVVPHQEVREEVQVLKEWTEVLKFTF